MGTGGSVAGHNNLERSRSRKGKLVLPRRRVDHSANAPDMEMTLAEWKKTVEKLSAAGDEQALRNIGGLGSDHIHRFRVKWAIVEGRPVSLAVLADYPELRGEHLESLGK